MGYQPNKAWKEGRGLEEPRPQEPPKGKWTNRRDSHDCRGYAQRAQYEDVFTTRRVTFGKKHEKGILHPHDDALVITMQVVNFTTRRILVDNGSSVDILTGWLGIRPDWLCPVPVPLKGYTSGIVQPMGVITLSVLARKKGGWNHGPFFGGEVPSLYNVIMGHPSLNNLRVKAPQNEVSYQLRSGRSPQRIGPSMGMLRLRVKARGQGSRNSWRSRRDGHGTFTSSPGRIGQRGPR